MYVSQNLFVYKIMYRNASMSTESCEKVWKTIEIEMKKIIKCFVFSLVYPLMLSAIFLTSFIPTNTLIPVVSLGSSAKQCAAERNIRKLLNGTKSVGIKVRSYHTWWLNKILD